METSTIKHTLRDETFFFSFARGIVFFSPRNVMISKPVSESSCESFDSFLGTSGRLQRVVTFLWVYLYPDWMLAEILANLAGTWKNCEFVWNVASLKSAVLFLPSDLELLCPLALDLGIGGLATQTLPDPPCPLSCHKKSTHIVGLHQVYHLKIIHFKGLTQSQMTSIVWFYDQTIKVIKPSIVSRLIRQQVSLKPRSQSQFKIYWVHLGHRRGGQNICRLHQLWNNSSHLPKL